MNLYPTFEQGLKAELPLFRHLTLLHIAVTPHRFGQQISVLHLAPTGHVLHPSYQQQQATFLVAGVSLTPRSVKLIRKLIGHTQVNVDLGTPRLATRGNESSGFVFLVGT